MTRTGRPWLASAAFALFLMPPVAGGAQEPAPAAVTAAVATQPTARDESNQAIIDVDSAGAQLIGTAELGGLEVYDLSGARLGAFPAGDASGVDVRAGVDLNGRRATILAVTDNTDNRLRLFERDGDASREISARAIQLGFAAENVCLFRNGGDGALYAFVVSDGGEIDQLLLYPTADGRMDARQARRLSFPSPVTYCVVDDRTGDLYVAHEATGIWRFDANPEADASPRVVDVGRIGHIDDEVAGLALYDGGPGARFLVASDASANRLLVYDRENDHRFVGALTLTGADGAAVEEPSGLFATSAALGPALPNGALVAANENARRYEIIDFRAVAAALGLNVGAPQGMGAPAEPQFPVVRARVESVPVPSAGDAADDPAIWPNPADPAASLWIGTNKRAGLHLYDMAGRELHFAADGKMNNVDLRDGFRLGGRDVVLVTASNRTNGGIAIYVLDPEAQRLIDVADGPQPTGLSDPYGLCMYRARGGRTYVFISDPDGLIRQWELVATREGRVRARQVRDIRFSSQTEGCVADDENGTLWVGEEDVGLWRLNAEPRGPEQRRLVDRVDGNPAIRDDIEGMGIYDLGGGRGYIVVSSQGNDSYAVYRREGDNAYLGSFRVVADGARGIDGISETDGLDVTSRNLGPGFEHGAMIAQDGRNVLPAETQNFKIVSWTDIAAALNLEVRR
jgi:3-phytase